jgi:hypothetical protein
MCFLRRMGLEAFRSHACSLVPTRGESSSAPGTSPVIVGARSSRACAQGYATVKVHARHGHNETSCGHGERSCCKHPVPTMRQHDVLELRTPNTSEAQNAWHMSRRTHGGQVSVCACVCSGSSRNFSVSFRRSFSLSFGVSLCNSLDSQTSPPGPEGPGRAW